jgi:predicted RNA-binding protein YlxR (DUF448 family)
VAPKSELIRFALAREGATARKRALIDAAGTMPGRGAYLCTSQPGAPSKECLELARKRGGFARTLRCAVTIGPELVESTK